ncbi:hypothetical protein P3X46_010628, partial [Hevea brasiliensis]
RINQRLERFIRESRDERKASTCRNKDIITEKDMSMIYVINVIASRPNIGKEIITIGSNDHEVKQPHSDLLVVSVQINRYIVRQVLIDTGRSVNLLTKEVLEKLGHKSKNLAKVMYPLIGLGDKTILVFGIINLVVVLGDEGYKREICTKFVMVDIPLSYNIILSQPIKMA